LPQVVVVSSKRVVVLVSVVVVVVIVTTVVGEGNDVVVVGRVGFGTVVIEVDVVMEPIDVVEADCVVVT
jgi:hypothetical protein